MIYFLRMTHSRHPLIKEFHSSMADACKAGLHYLKIWDVKSTNGENFDVIEIDETSCPRYREMYKTLDLAGWEILKEKHIDGEAKKKEQQRFKYYLNKSYESITDKKIHRETR